MKNKILSIVVPTYNIENYIEKCLNSFIKKELLPLIEVIVVNDGSTDKSSNLAKKFSNKYPETFKVIDKENGGHGSTINTALKEATGTFFFIVDGDDWVNADALYKVVIELQKNIDVDAIFFNYVREIKSKDKRIVHKLKGNLNIGNVDLDKAIFDINHQIGLSNTIYKLENLRKINLKLDEKMFYVDIEYILYPLQTIKKAIYVDESVYHYLIGRPNQSINIENSLKHLNDREKMITNVLKYFNKLKKIGISEFTKKVYNIRMSSNIENYYEILIIGDKNFSSKIKEIDGMVKDLDEELYKFIGKSYLYINIARKFNYCPLVLKVEYFLNRIIRKIKSIIEEVKQ